MHPGQNNSLKPLWSVQDKGFIIDLRLIVTLWITYACVRFGTRLRTFSVSTSNGVFPSLAARFDLLLISQRMLIERAPLKRLEIHGTWLLVLLGGFPSVPTKMDRLRVLLPFSLLHADGISRSKRIDAGFLLNRRVEGRRILIKRKESADTFAPLLSNLPPGFDYGDYRKIMLHPAPIRREIKAGQGLRFNRSWGWIVCVFTFRRE